MQQHGPWKIKSSEVKYKSPWMEIREDQVVQPDGKEGIYSLAKLLSGVSVLPIDDEENVYLASEFRYAMGKDCVGTFCGAIDGNEEPLETAKRELKEEAGIEAKEWIALGRMDPFTSAVVAPAWLFLARSLSFGKTEQEGTENIKMLKMPLEQAVKMVMDSEITLSPSALNILKAAKYLGKL